eukprot:TRINITY_DN78_c4_g1_i1.p1 TRINITY_DN78_c4_g1~~TRINITY_DN78_c4_g1_i1.p1  ORF type:complete len:294 (+),score=101.20 TRINITY_DN78_c4_g1_i1:68-949(+)
MPAFPSDAFKNEVLYSVADGVAVITLNAPDRMNTMSGALNQGVAVALDLAAEDPDVRCVVITGAGRAFCAGGNLKSETEGAASGFKAKEGQKIPATVHAAVRQLRLSMTTSELMRCMDKPTIAAVNGAAAGAGFSWACACDLRFCSDAAVFRSAFLTAGLSGDFGGTWTLPRIVGPAKARELYLLNRKVGPEEAKRIGLVSEVFPRASFMDSVMQIARELAAAPPLALKRIKQNLVDSDSDHSFASHLNSEADRHARSAYHPDAGEAGKAFVQRRAPKFAPVAQRESWQYARL